MTNFTKAERTYQNSKPYDFRDLELSLDFKIKECELLKKQKQRLEEENASLRYDIKKYEKIFEGEQGIIERMANPTKPEDYQLSITVGSIDEADKVFKSIEEAKKQ